MMKDTPRTFVGSVVLVLEGPVAAAAAALVRAAIEHVDGISHCDVDASAGTVMVTAQRPVDRTDLVALLHRLGCHVRS